MTATLNDFNLLCHDLAQVAQKVYDAWDQSFPDGDPELGFGGICQDIAEGISNFLNENGIEAVVASAQVGEQHVYVIAPFEEGVFTIDIPPNVYPVSP